MKNAFQPGILMPEVTREETPLQIREGEPFSLDSILSLEMIRTHTKTDDVAAVTDEQLRLYRKASLEAAEQYTSLLIMETRRLTEKVRRPRLFSLIQRPVKHTLQYQLSDSRILVQGLAGSYFMEGEVGKREIYIQTLNPILGGSCCNGDDSRMDTRVTYIAGYKTVEDIPGGIILGCLKYIAWCVANPGDVLMTVRNTQKSNNATIIGTNNVGWSSGAVELWRQYAREEF